MLRQPRIASWGFIFLCLNLLPGSKFQFDICTWIKRATTETVWIHGCCARNLTTTVPHASFVIPIIFPKNPNNSIHIILIGMVFFFIPVDSSSIIIPMIIPRKPYNSLSVWNHQHPASIGLQRCRSSIAIGGSRHFSTEKWVTKGPRPRRWLEYPLVN